MMIIDHYLVEKKEGAVSVLQVAPRDEDHGFVVIAASVFNVVGGRGACSS